MSSLKATVKVSPAAEAFVLEQPARANIPKTQTAAIVKKSDFLILCILLKKCRKQYTIYLQ
jgi:hypothetical protein